MAQQENEVEDMDTSDTPYYWFYKAKCGDWHRVESMSIFLSSDDLEEYYKQNPFGVMTTDEGLFLINFSESLLFNLTTRQTWQIKRSCQNGCRLDDISSLPAHKEKPYQIIPLRSETNDYKKVENIVRTAGLLYNPIQSISRIENMDLWRLFCRKRIQWMRLNEKTDMKNAEKWLFHGTSEQNLQSICKFNFNCRLSERKRTAHIYGKGTYFAKFASYAAAYSEINGQGIKMILLARVIVGTYKEGQQDYCTPNDDNEEYKYDSCVDNMANPMVFVIFDSNQIYPEYVIKFW